MKVINVILAILMIAIFAGNAPLLNHLYPLRAIDPNHNELAYVIRNKMYEVLFCLGFVTGMLNTNRAAKALFSFAFIISFASCFDKIVLDITQYLKSDLIVVAFAIGISFWIYKRERNAG